MWRRISNGLDTVYTFAGYGAAVLLVFLCGLILYSVLARLLSLYLGGVNDLAGYVMATSTFMALSYTFRSNGHIRVGLIIQRFTGRARRGLEIACLAIMAAVVWFFACYMGRLVYFAYIFGERSEGADATPLWLPQTPVALGSALFAIAVTHSLIQALFDYDSINPETASGEVNEV
ncbi:TRAP-type C4-dicarboxylate transport system permease small subunit [Roseibium hamelinense]|uniref:TRAP transporter small permease protein n=1 Tax=Roseibium hamelinense TaxID=150831 RepID=A0A562THZ3_9HYPH|nr:TRAP transporter small permease [Roseibium hamelinense]MTI42457.1 TRAP transporter small permease [Roseibium hamelinense]TWI92486.1 TRAP-type C4-dicarboxylate transport system permease small subunit [Roseibium hamelinense]